MKYLNDYEETYYKESEEEVYLKEEHNLQREELIDKIIKLDQDNINIDDILDIVRLTITEF